jgi:pimeloyl-ACP methyl ester carboxylesterase
VVSRPGGLVFVADGAGDFRATSQALRQAITEEELPLTLETFLWSHGYLRIIADQTDLPYTRLQGHRLAGRVRDCRVLYPDTPIYLVGHSAGAAVVLAAAEALPPGYLDRVILLSPSTPADYDLRGALRAVRTGIDVFHSPADGWYLRCGVFLTGLVRGRLSAPSGRGGFEPAVCSAEDAASYAKLHQYPWGPWLSWTGHEGGHFGCYQQGYLRAFVIPLLATERSRL